MAISQTINILNGDFATPCVYFPARQSWIEAIQNEGIDPTQHVRRGHPGLILFRYLTDAREMGLVWDHSVHDMDQIAVFSIDTDVLDKDKCFTNNEVKLQTGGWYTFYPNRIVSSLRLISAKTLELENIE